MTIKEIDVQISALKQQRAKLEKQEREIFKKQALNNVGRCFIIDGKQYVKVIDIPQEQWYIAGCHFNEYQYPALYLGKDPEIIEHNIIPFYEDTLFSAAWGVGHDMLHEYKEITPEEFNAEFEKILRKFADRVRG